MQLGILNINTNTTIDTDLTVNAFIIDTTSGAITLTLPASPLEGAFYYIKDNGNAGTNAITISGNGKIIESDTTYTINTNYDYTELLFCSTNNKWFIL